MDLNRNSQISRRRSLAALGSGVAAFFIPAWNENVEAADAITCVSSTPTVTEGPYWVDEKLFRSDIRTDPTTGIARAGTPLTLTITVQNSASGSCTPLVGAYVDIWHCDAKGIYSDESTYNPGGGTGNVNTSGQKFLRGYQITDANGSVTFTTIYPGWYSGRTIHIHFRVRTYSGSGVVGNFVSQIFFDETINNTVLAQSAYSRSTSRDTTNNNDMVYQVANKERMLATAAGSNAAGYQAQITAGVSLTAPDVTTPVTASYALPQFAFGGGWSSVLYLSNITSAAVNAQIAFVDTNGGALSVTTSEQGAFSAKTIPIGARSTVAIQAPNTGSLQQPWVEIAIPSGVIGYGVFRQSPTGRADQEAVVPLSAETGTAAEMVFDNVNTITALALANPTNQAIVVTITAFGNNGTQVGTSSVTIGARSKIAAALTDFSGLSGAASQLGYIEISSSGGAFTGLGLRFASQAFTSIPVTYR